MTAPAVLIVDDSELILQMLEMVCQQAGWRAVTCAHFGDVSQVAASERFSAIISDLNMPDVPGGDPIAALRQIEALDDVPIILLSGRPAAELTVEAKIRGADAALSKDAGLPGLMQALPPLLQELTGRTP